MRIAGGLLFRSVAERDVSEIVESGLDVAEGEVERREWIKRSEA